MTIPIARRPALTIDKTAITAATRTTASAT